MKEACSIAGCNGSRLARGWCGNHYAKWRRTGTPFRPEVSVEQHFTRHITFGSSEDCWPWRGIISDLGYGVYNCGQLTRFAHRWSYEHYVGPIPDDMVLDHTCHTTDLACPGGPSCPHRRCCNPGHLEIVTRGENARRGRRGGPRKTHCKRGHEFDEANTYVTTNDQRGWAIRQCRTCKRDDMRARRQAKQCS